MTDERVEPTKEWLDALIARLGFWGQGLANVNQVRDAILASQPERVECPTKHQREIYVGYGDADQDEQWIATHCPDCGAALETDKGE